jgi:hypothetical protein
MSDSLEKIDEYFQVACYTELAEYVQQLSSADELNDLLNLLDTHQIRRIVRNSIKNQAKLIGSFYEHLAMETQGGKSSSSTFNTGHIESRKEAEEMLNSNFAWLETRLSSIDTKLTRFRAALRAWIETSSNEAYEAGLLGSILGGLLLGPVGAFAGAVLGSGSSGPAGSEFKREFENLIIDYNHLLNEVKESLDECFEMSGDLFSQVATKFSSSNFSKSIVRTELSSYDAVGEQILIVRVGFNGSWVQV